MKTKCHVPRVMCHVALLMILSLAACAPATNEAQPPEIAYGLDGCEACGMIIGEPKFAAATLLENEQTLKFDDIGEMFVYHMDHPELQVRAWFVHDYDSERWVHAKNASYVIADALKSPMGHAIAAFGTKTAADAFAREYAAQVFTFDEMRVEIHMH